MTMPTDFEVEFRALAEDQTVLPLWTTPARAWCMLAAIQLAARHPQARDTEAMRVAIEMARHIQTLVATTPALARVAEQGWDQTYDLGRR